MTKSAILGRLEAVNKELWLVLSLFAIALLMNHVVAEFDPAVVDAFQAVFRRGQLEIWSAPLSAA